MGARRDGGVVATLLYCAGRIVGHATKHLGAIAIATAVFLLGGLVLISVLVKSESEGRTARERVEAQRALSEAERASRLRLRISQIESERQARIDKVRSQRDTRIDEVTNALDKQRQEIMASFGSGDVVQAAVATIRISQAETRAYERIWQIQKDAQSRIAEIEEDCERRILELSGRN